MATAPYKRKRPITWDNLPGDIKRHIVTMVIEDNARSIALEKDKLVEEYDVLSSWRLSDDIPHVLRFFPPDMPAPGMYVMRHINMSKDENKEKRRELKEHCFSYIWWITCILLRIEGNSLVPKDNLRVLRLVHTKLGGLFA